MIGLGRLLLHGVVSGAAALVAAVATAQSISVDKPIYGANETIQISYSTPSPCRCELHIINLSDILRHASHDAWIRDAFYKPGGVTTKPLFYTESETRTSLEAGRSGTFQYSSNLLRASIDKSRSWFRALLIDNTTKIIAQAPFMVIKRHGPAPSMLKLENEVGRELGSFIGTQRLVARLPVAPSLPEGIRSDLWPFGAAYAARSWTLPANGNAQTLQLDGFVPGSYELRFTNRLGLALGSGAFELTYPYSETALQLVPARSDAYTTNDPPKLAIAYAGRNYVLVMFRVEGGRLERLWGWEVGNNAQFDFVRGLPANLRNLPPATYEFRLYLGNNEIDGRYLVSRKQLVIGAPSVAPTPTAPAGQISLGGGRPVLVGDDFDVSFSVPVGSEPTWLALYPKPYLVSSCTILEAMPPMSVKEGRDGNARFRYPVPVSGSGTATLLAPWVPGEYEVRIYRGELPNDVGKLAYPKATLLASMPLSVGLAEPLFTVRPSVGAVVELGTAIEVEVQPSDKLRRDLFKSWRVQVAIMRASETLPGGSVAPAQVAGAVLELASGRGGKVRFAPIDYDPGPYEILVSATAPDGSLLRFVVRHKFDVPPPPTPALPGDASFVRAKGFAAPDGYAPQIPRPDDCVRGSLAALLGQPPPAVVVTNKPPPSKPTLAVTEWVAGDLDSDADDRYVPVRQIFAGFPYVVEARFPEPQNAESYTVTGPGNAAIVVKRTTDPLIYRSKQIVFLPGATQ